MPYIIRWEDVQQVVIRHELMGKWTTDEYLQSWQQAMTLAREADHDVYIMSYLPSNAPPPPGSNLLGLFQAVANMRPDNLLLLVPVEGNALPK